MVVVCNAVLHRRNAGSSESPLRKRAAKFVQLYRFSIQRTKRDITKCEYCLPVLHPPPAQQCAALTARRTKHEASDVSSLSCRHLLLHLQSMHSMRTRYL